MYLQKMVDEVRARRASIVAVSTQRVGIVPISSIVVCMRDNILGVRTELIIVVQSSASASALASTSAPRNLLSPTLATSTSITTSPRVREREIDLTLISQI